MDHAGRGGLRLCRPRSHEACVLCNVPAPASGQRGLRPQEWVAWRPRLHSAVTLRIPEVLGSSLPKSEGPAAHARPAWGCHVRTSAVPLAQPSCGCSQSRRSTSVACCVLRPGLDGGEFSSPPAALPPWTDGDTEAREVATQLSSGPVLQAPGCHVLAQFSREVAGVRTCTLCPPGWWLPGTSHHLRSVFLPMLCLWS